VNPGDLLLGGQHLLGLLQDAQPATPARSPEVYQALLRGFLALLIFLANAAGGLVVGVAIVRGLARYLLDLARAHGGEVPKEAIRLSLGRSLALALEFQVGADILGTALDPTLNDILVLAAVVGSCARRSTSSWAASCARPSSASARASPRPPTPSRTPRLVLAPGTPVCRARPVATRTRTGRASPAASQAPDERRRPGPCPRRARPSTRSGAGSGPTSKPRLCRPRGAQDEQRAADQQQHTAQHEQHAGRVGRPGPAVEQRLHVRLPAGAHHEGSEDEDQYGEREPPATQPRVDCTECHQDNDDRYLGDPRRTGWCPKGDRFIDGMDRHQQQARAHQEQFAIHHLSHLHD
jgi:uncharacterized membrane protein